MDKDQNSTEFLDQTSSAQKTSPNTQKPKISKAISVLVVVTLVVAAGSGFGVYKWQHGKVNASATKISDLQKQSNTLKTQVASLQKKYQDVSKELSADLQAQSTAKSSAGNNTTVITQSDLTLTVNSGTRYNASGEQGGQNTGVAVEMTLTNATTTAISFSIASLELQDSQNHIYQIMPSISGLYLPSGYVSLTNQTISPGQTVKGSLTFQVNDLTQTSFKLINGSKTYSFTAS